MSEPTVVFVTVANASVFVSMSVNFVNAELSVDSVAAPVGNDIVPPILFRFNSPEEFEDKNCKLLPSEAILTIPT